MRSRVTKWFETKVSFEKIMDDGQQKKVSELYVVDALSFTEAEQRITEEMSSYISGDFEVRSIRPATYGEIFFSDAPSDDRWFRARLQFIIIDEKSGKEKRSAVSYLVQGASLESALKNINAVMGTTMNDYVVVGLSETLIMDVYEYTVPKDKAEEEGDDKPEYEQ